MEHWYDDSAHDDHKAGLARVVSQERPRPPLDSGTCAIAKVEAGMAAHRLRRGGGDRSLPRNRGRWRMSVLSMENSFEFDIAAGVRQGRVLSPRLFCSVLEWALSKWRKQLNGVGYNFQDGGVSLLDLRFADDILIFAKFYEEIGHV